MIDVSRRREFWRLSYSTKRVGDVASTMQYCIEPACIVDCLSKPHHFFVFILSQAVGIASLLFVRWTSWQDQDQGLNGSWEALDVVLLKRPDIDEL